VPGVLAVLLTAAAVALPAPDAPLARDPQALATDLTNTTRELRTETDAWGGHGDPPQAVTYLALHHQRILRLMSERKQLGDTTLRRLPDDVKGEARDTVLARRHLLAIPRGKPPQVRTIEAAPADALIADYKAAQERYGIHWTVLAAINFVESAFGRVRSASEAGARGPMQFMPATWRAYGQGDIEDPHDAIFAAARYLKANGGAIYAYNHSFDYVAAVRLYASRMRKDGRAFLTYYAWQVYYAGKRITGPH
jgi:membrane-bound lytic murein transglycosylase B